MFIVRAVQSKLLGTATLFLIVALSAAVRIQSLRLEQQQHRTTEVALQASNAIAERDSTHDVTLENGAVAKLLGDSLRLVEKQVVQVKQHADDLDRAVHHERVANYALSVTLDSVRQSVTAAVITSASPVILSEAKDITVRYATFHIRKAPFAVDAHVEIPPSPGNASMEISVAADSVELEARIVCGPPDANGVRRATLNTRSPTWARIRFGRVEQDPDVCVATRPPASQGGWRFDLRPMVGFGVTVAPRTGRVLGGLILGWTLARKS